MPQKILIIITKGEIGGAQQFVLSLAEGLKNEGMTVTVGFGSGDFLVNNLKTSGISIKIFKHLKRTHNFITNILFIWELRNYLLTNNFDYIHFNSTNTLWGAVSTHLVRQKPQTLFTVHGLSILNPNYQSFFLTKFFYKLFFKLFIKLVDKVIFVSNADYKFALKEKLVKKGYVIYNGISKINFLPRHESRKQLSNLTNFDLENCLIAGSIGRLSYQKNYEFLIDNWPKILQNFPALKLLIIGDGPKKDYLKRKIISLGLENNIFLVGSQINASQYLMAFDLFILPSRYEGMSLTLMESQAAGIPTLATNLEGNLEILGEAGSTYVLNNLESFTSTLKALLTNRQVSTSLSGKLLDHSNLFSSDKMIANYLKLFS